jgi:2-(3-amino-3-carboxypropyl)histidine synthase
MFEGYELDLQRMMDWVKDNGYRMVGIQLPEGLKMRHRALSEALEEATGAVTIFVADPCFGACDLADARLEPLGIEALIHIGHTQMGANHRIPVLFEPLKSTIDIKTVVQKAIPMLAPPVGLLTTAQHLHTLPKVKALLEDAGLSWCISKGTRAQEEGQVVGCSYSALHNIGSQAGSFLFIGSGRFHPLGAALSTTKKVLAADPYLGEVEDMTEARDRALRQRHGLITKAKDAKSLVILVSTKQGQSRMNLARALKSKALDNLIPASIVAMENIIPDNLMGIDGDFFVSTACPRIALDDQARFDRPVLTPKELEIVFGDRSWEDYVLDEF